jgi:hypothetical protein
MPHVILQEQTIDDKTPLTAGTVRLGAWDVGNAVNTQGGSSLLGRLDLTSINIPFCVGAYLAAGGAPSTAYLTVQLLISGELVWQGTSNVPLTGYGTPPPVLSGGTTGFSESLQAPIAFRPGQTFAAAYMIQFDADVDEIILSFAAVSTIPLGPPTPMPASVGYTAVYEPLILTP